eukprot:343312_1
MYKGIAECFIFYPFAKSEISESETDDAILLITRCRWKCFNCYNVNIPHSTYIEKTNDIKICIVCGVSQRDSIIMTLRNQQTFTMINDNIQVEYDEKTKAEIDEIDKLINIVVNHKSTNIFCPNQNNNKPCFAVLRLCKILIKHKRWLFNIYRTNKSYEINDTTKLNLHDFCDENKFKELCNTVIQNNIELTSTQKQALIGAFIDIKSFISMTRKAFGTFMQNKLMLLKVEVKMSPLVSIYSKIKQSIEKLICIIKMGTFLANINMEELNNDYIHILHYHIHDGSRQTVESTFKFFHNLIHSEDSIDEIELCPCIKRRNQRNIDLTCQSKTSSNHQHSTHTKFIELQNYHIQAKLDLIHSYLVHSDYNLFIKRYKNDDTENEADDTKYDIDNNEHKDSNQSSIHNKEKYISNVSDSNLTSYRFGIDHSYSNVNVISVFTNIRDELLHNDFWSVSEEIFDRYLVDAIDYHRVVLRSQFGNTLICKEFDPAFKLIRNELIGVRHIFVISIYTNISQFCTVFRQTYRRMNKEKTDQDVRKRHKQFVLYAKSLFEAVQFFGENMTSTMKVYHGLDKVMKFTEFTAFFNQPVSTTTSLRVAAQFSDGAGNILTLRASMDSMDKQKKAKYFSVSWLSCFPEEKELLFFGSYIRFKIHDIITFESHTMISHREELLMLNKFQQIIGNQKNDLNANETMIFNHKLSRNLTSLIKQKQNKYNQSTSMDTTVSISKYGVELFDYFCDQQRETVVVADFESLENTIKKTLFYQKSELSLIPFIKVFNYCSGVTLNELDIKQMTQKAERYIHMVLNYIQQRYILSHLCLNKIEFKSKTQQDHKINVTLQQLADKYAKRVDVESNKWILKYENIENMHVLSFVNNQPKQTDFKELTTYSSTNKQHSLSLRDMKESPAIFMYITSVNQKSFDIEIVSDEKSLKKRKYFIKILNGIGYGSKLMEKVFIPRQQTYGVTEIEIEEKQCDIYYLGIFENKDATKPITNSTQIQFKTLDANKIPPYNSLYKPSKIDTNDILIVRNEKKQQVMVYWNTPSDCFGEISYKIVYINGNQQEDISFVPHKIPFSSIPVQFKIKTQCVVENKIYESEASNTIGV